MTCLPLAKPIGRPFNKQWVCLKAAGDTETLQRLDKATEGRHRDWQQLEPDGRAPPEPALQPRAGCLQRCAPGFTKVVTVEDEFGGALGASLRWWAGRFQAALLAAGRLPSPARGPCGPLYPEWTELEPALRPPDR